MSLTRSLAMINQQFSIERSVDESIIVVKIPHCDRSIVGVSLSMAD